VSLGPVGGQPSTSVRSPSTTAAVPRPRGSQRIGLWCLGAVLFLAGCTTTPTVSSGPVLRPAATSFSGLPQVGPLFAGSVQGGVHFCTASVVHSPGHDLLVTAAHCLFGTGSDLVFAPGYHDGITPFGSWTIRAAYVSSRWLTDRDPQADFAFLTVEPQQRSGETVDVEDVVGADELVTSRGLRAQVTVVGYPLGTGGKPITCANQTYDHGGYPTFDCDGYVDGTSGSPWIAHFDPGTGRGDLYGVIGGLHQGGCTPETSYSSYFGPSTKAVYDRAISGGPGDDVPSAGGDGC